MRAESPAVPAVRVPAAKNTHSRPDLACYNMPIRYESMTLKRGGPDMRKVSRVQEKGQVTIPNDLRRKWGLKPGDLVGFEETERGILITRQAVVATDALDKLGEVLRESGVTLEEWIESGREIRGKLIEEEYGLTERR